MRSVLRPTPPASGAVRSWTGHGLRRSRLVAGAATLALALAACSGAGDDPPEAAGPAATGDGSLAGLCPDPVVVQTSWWPESTHGGLYHLLGERTTLDATRKAVRGPLVAGGKELGVDLEIRPGGPARGQQSVAALMKADPSITLGQQATEDTVLGWAQGIPTVGVLAPFYVDPVVFIWDRTKHPDFTSIQDVGQTDTTVYTFRSANTDYLVGSGILRAAQIDHSYDGSPSLFTAEPDSVVGGFATNEPFIYRSMGRDVDYAYVADAGYPDYRNTLTVRQADRDGLDPCLRRLVPVLQRGMIEFMAEPAPTLARIVALNTSYRTSFPYPQAQAEYGVKVMREDGLVSDPRQGGFGSFDPDRNSRMIDILRPVYTAQRIDVPPGLSAADIATNDYVDPTIRMGS